MSECPGYLYTSTCRTDAIAEFAVPCGQARKKSAQQQLLLARSASKVPLIGRDRLAILRANGTMPHVNGSIFRELLAGPEGQGGASGACECRDLAG